jgi:hypothetical protein
METLRRAEDTTEAVPRTTSSRVWTVLRSRWPAVKMTRPNARALRSRAPAGGSMPTNARPARTVGKSGGQCPYGPPAKLRYPSPDARLRAAARYDAESGVRPAPYRDVPIRARAVPAQAMTAMRTYSTGARPDPWASTRSLTARGSVIPPHPVETRLALPSRKDYCSPAEGPRKHRRMRKKADGRGLTGVASVPGSWYHVPSKNACRERNRP